MAAVAGWFLELGKYLVAFYFEIVFEANLAKVSFEIQNKLLWFLGRKKILAIFKMTFLSFYLKKILIGVGQTELFLKKLEKAHIFPFWF